VDRSAEMRRLDGLLQQAAGGAGRMVIVTGEAGIGKTALLRAFLGRARQRADDALTLLRFHCVEQYGAGDAYLPFLDALGTLLVGKGKEPTAALLRSYAPTWCLHLPALSASPADRSALQQQTIGATKDRMLREMCDVLEAAASASVLVGFMEDVQWLDSSSADLVRHLARRVSRQRMLMIGTLRPAEMQAEPRLRAFLDELRTHEYCQEVSLGPLSEGDVADYLEQRFPDHGLPPSFAPLLHLKTEGHPLFVCSLVQHLVERGDVAWREGRWGLARVLSEADLAAPESVRGMIRRKVEALDEEERAAVEHASVLGREFHSSALAAMLEADELATEERLQRLDRAHRLLDVVGDEELPDGTLGTRYRFTNALYQEVLYEAMVSRRRVQLHGRAAAALLRHHGRVTARLATPLALHFERARDFERAAACRIEAGDSAARLYANTEAEQHYRQAITLLERLPPVIRTDQEIRTYQRLGAVDLASGRFAEAVASYTRMLEAARNAGAAALEHAALSGLCNALFFSRRIEEMAVRAHQALGAAERAGDESLQLEAMLLVAQILQEEGDLADCRSLLDEVRARARALGEQRTLLAALLYRGCVHYWQADFEEGQPTLREALGLALEQREGFMALIGYQFLGLTLGGVGRVGEALATLGEGMAMGRRNDDRFWLPRLASHVGWLHREMQDFEGAAAHDLEAVETARAAGVEPARASALINLSLAYTHGGRRDEGLEILRGLSAEVRQAPWFSWLFEMRLESALAEHWLARGDLARARTHAHRTLAHAQPREARVYLAGAHRFLAEAARAEGELAEAEGHLERGLAVLRGRAAHLAAWRLLALRGALRTDAGRRAEARSAYAEAATTVRFIAAHVDDALLRQTFLDAPSVRAVLEAAGA
jgi:tetratricopeptide (TPR) repeat protein